MYYVCTVNIKANYTKLVRSAEREFPIYCTTIVHGSVIFVMNTIFHRRTQRGWGLRSFAVDNVKYEHKLFNH